MRLATILPCGSVEPVPVAAAPDGTWIELAGVIGRPAKRLEEALPWVMMHGAHTAERARNWRGPRYRESEFAFLPPVVRPPAFRDFEAFEQHVKTVRALGGHDVPAAWYEAPPFFFANHLALLGHEAEVHAPQGARQLDYELELGVVLGHGGRDIRVERAWEHVAGVTIVNGFAARDLLRRAATIGLGPAKGADFATGVGPWLVTRDALADRIEGERLTLAMSARVNGHEFSRGNAGTLYHSIPRLIAQASRDAEVFPGDLIATGPVGSGCLLEQGADRGGRWLQAGDTVELEIERIGVLRHRVVARR